jgi:hypothetical protein
MNIGSVSWSPREQGPARRLLDELVRDQTAAHKPPDDMKNTVRLQLANLPFENSHKTHGVGSPILRCEPEDASINGGANASRDIAGNRGPVVPSAP